MPAFPQEYHPPCVQPCLIRDFRRWCGTAPPLRQGWVALASHPTPCPRPCCRRRTSAATVVLPPSPGTSPPLHATTPPPSESSDDSVVQRPSMLHRRWTAIDAHRTLLVLRLRAWSSTSSSSARTRSNTISHGSHSTSSHMRLGRVFSRLSVSSVRDWFQVFY